MNTSKKKRSQVIALRRRRRLHSQLYLALPLSRRNRKQKRVRPKGLHACLSRPCLLLLTMSPTMKHPLLMTLLQQSLKNRPLRPLHAFQLKEAIANFQPNRQSRPLRGRFRGYPTVRRCYSSFRNSGRISSGKNTRCTLFSRRRRASA